MKNWRQGGILLIITVILTVGLWSTGRTQTADPQQELARAHVLAETDRGAEAVPILLAISQNHPNTDFDARAQLQLAWTHAVLHDLPRTRQVWAQVAARFSYTPYGFTAESQLLDAQLLTDGIPFDQYLTGLDALIQQAGGPPLQALRSGHRAPIQPRPPMTELSQRYALSQLLLTAAGRIARRPAPEANAQLTQQAINIWVYARDAYPDILGESVTRDLRDEVLNASGQLEAAADFPADTTPPRITKLKPDGSTGRRSDIVAKLNDGSILESQVNLQSLNLTVDGVAVRPSVFTKNSRKAKVAGNKPFQKVKLRYRPTQPFVAGTHTVILKIADLAGNQVERSWSFTVRDGRKDDRDDEADDGRCDQEPGDNDDD